MKFKSSELSILRALERPDPEKLLLNTIIIQMLGAVLNIAQTVSVRENSMKTFKFKKDANKLEEISKKIMNAQLSERKIVLKEELRDFLVYEHAYELYRVLANLSPKGTEYIKNIADELESKEKLYKQIILNES